MGYTTYSFADVTMAISHESVGQKVVNGEGIGSIAIAFTNDRTTHDVSADGSVMVSKIRARNGTITLSIQQTSSVHEWLWKWFNAIETASASSWAKTTILINGLGKNIFATGVSPQKQADQPFQQQGQQVSWTFMCADIQENVV